MLPIVQVKIVAHVDAVIYSFATFEGWTDRNLSIACLKSAICSALILLRKDQEGEKVEEWTSHIPDERKDYRHEELESTEAANFGQCHLEVHLVALTFRL